MPLAILMTLLLISSWLFSEVLVLLPLNLLHALTPPGWLGLTAALLLLFWCFGE
ncbi:MAG TPA: hypothetical protein V6D12_01265 [Candidatus Obscuribacterales bacterium]